jgi:hypothetical protein
LPSRTADVGWTIPFTAVATSVTAILTQIFLGHRWVHDIGSLPGLIEGIRVFLLTSNRLLFVLIAALSVLGFVFGCIAGIKSGLINE